MDDVFVVIMFPWNHFATSWKAKKKINTRRKPLKPEGEAQWLKKRRALVTKAIESQAGPANVDGVAKLSKSLWCNKQDAEVKRQKNKSHENSCSFANYGSINYHQYNTF